jgi:gamma-D-glutamyl-L-lysine dipeptidyl-peptidase
MYGIANLSIVPIRSEARDASEQVSQLLFGETFLVLEQNKQWTKIQCVFDAYEGWIDTKQFLALTEEQFLKLDKYDKKFNTNLVEFLTKANNELTTIVLGADVTSTQPNALDINIYSFDGDSTVGIKAKNNLIKTALLYLNSPYLWGGKSPFGIDCSGFTQMVYKLNGYKLYRDAYQQAEQGEPLSFIEESEPGDLAFFDNEDGKITHVGILMNDNYIIHASGKVRIDRLDHLGIYNVDNGKHTHKLRVIKKII